MVLKLFLCFLLLSGLDAGQNPSESVLTVSESIKNMGFALYRQFVNQPGNILISPLSAATIFALAYMGAEENTAKEMAFALLLPNNKQQVSVAFQQIINDLNNNENENSRLTFNIVNKLYPSNEINVNEKFIEIARNSFNAEIESIDYTNKEQAAEQINNYVESNTNNKIKNLISPDSLDPSPSLVLINALHFVGRWKKEFKESIDIDFHQSLTDIKSVPGMMTQDIFGYGYDPTLNARVLELPYSDPNYSFIIILPNEIDGISTLEQFAPFNLKRIISRLRKTKIVVRLPKFQLEQTIDLKEQFSKLGMADAFNSATANFKNISNEPLYISQAKQKVSMDLNEKGVEAAAASAVSQVFLSRTPVFNVDRPFIFALIKKLTTLTIMLGRVTELE